MHQRCFYIPLYFTLFYLVNFSHGISNLRRCADKDCKAVISLARAVMDLDSADPDVLSFTKGNVVRVFSKHAGNEKHFWGGEVNNKQGYFPRSFVKEFKVFFTHPQHVVPTGMKNANYDNVDPTEPEKVQLQYQEDDETEFKEVPAENKNNLGGGNTAPPIEAKNNVQQPAGNANPVSENKPGEMAGAGVSDPPPAATTAAADGVTSDNKVADTTPQSENNIEVKPLEILKALDSQPISSVAADKKIEEIDKKEVPGGEIDPTEVDPTEAVDSVPALAPVNAVNNNVVTSNTEEPVPNKEEKLVVGSEDLINQAGSTKQKMDITVNVEKPAAAATQEKDPTEIDETEATETEPVAASKPDEPKEMQVEKDSNNKVEVPVPPIVETQSNEKTAIPEVIDQIPPSIVPNDKNESPPLPVLNQVPLNADIQNVKTLDEKPKVETLQSDNPPQKIDAVVSDKLKDNINEEVVNTAEVNNSGPIVSPTPNEEIKTESVQVEKETPKKGEWRKRRKPNNLHETAEKKHHALNFNNGGLGDVPDVKLTDEQLKEIARKKFLLQRQQGGEVTDDKIPVTEAQEDIELMNSKLNSINVLDQSVTPSSIMPSATLSEATVQQLAAEQIKPSDAMNVISPTINDAAKQEPLLPDGIDRQLEIKPSIAVNVDKKKEDDKSTPEILLNNQQSSVVLQSSIVAHTAKPEIDVSVVQTANLASVSPDIVLASSQIQQLPTSNNEGFSFDENRTSGVGDNINDPYHTAEFVSRVLLDDGKPTAPGSLNQPIHDANKTPTPEAVDQPSAEKPDGTILLTDPVLQTDKQIPTAETSPSTSDDVPPLDSESSGPSLIDSLPTPTKSTPNILDSGQEQDNNVTSMNKVLALGVRLTEPFLDAIIDKLPEDYRKMLETEHLGLPARHMLFIYIVTAVLVLLFTFCGFCTFCGGKKDKTLIRVQGKLRQIEEQYFITSKEKDDLEERIKQAEEKANKAEHNLKSHEGTKKRLQLDLQNVKLHNSALQRQVSSLEKDNETFKNQLEMSSSDVGTKDEQILNAQTQLLQYEETASSLQSQLMQMHTTMHEKCTRAESVEGQLEALTEEVEILTQSKNQLLQENQGWKDRVKDLEESVSSQRSEQKELQELVSFKDNEIDVLRDCLKQLKAFEKQSDEDGGEGDSGSQTIEEKLQAMTDVSRINAILQSVEEDKASFQQRLIIEQDSRADLEDQVKKLKCEVETLQQGHHNAEKQSQEAVTKLSVLSSYFKEKELQLQKELGEQQALRKQTEGKAVSSDTRVEELESEMSLYRKQIEDLKKEISNVERDFRMQISVQEKKAHENWLTARDSERKLKEAEQNNTVLRHKLMETESRNQYEGIIRPLPTRPLPPPGMMNGPPPFPPGERPISRSSGMPPSPLMRDAEVVSPPFDRMPPPPLGDRRPFLPGDRPGPLRGPPMPPLDRRPFPPMDRRSPPLMDRRLSQDRRSPPRRSPPPLERRRSPPPLERRPMSSIDQRSPPPTDRRYNDRRSPPPYRLPPESRMGPPRVSPVPYMSPQGPPPRGPPPNRRENSVNGIQNQRNV